MRTLHHGSWLLALEGIDGCGKSTQARLLCEALRGRGLEAVVFREPGDSAHGDAIRQLFSEGRSLSAREEMRLFLEDRRIDVHDNILPSLKRGAVVIMDRYYFSSMAYQGAQGIPVDEIREANESFAPRPDLTLVLDVAPSTGLARILARHDEPNSFEEEEQLAEARRLFLSFCSGDIRFINAALSTAEVHLEILEMVLVRIAG